MKTRQECMTSTQQAAIKVGLPRTHANCMQWTGVARPGKTAHDRLRGATKSKAQRTAGKIAYQEAL